MARMNLLDLVVIGGVIELTDSTELDYAKHQLLASLPDGIATIQCSARNEQDLVKAAVDAANRKGLASDARVLLIGCPYLRPTSDTFESLAAVLDAGYSAAFCYSSSQSLPDVLPDYLTVRGMERFVARLRKMPNQKVLPSSNLADMVLTTADAMRNSTITLSAVWVPAAFVHDFSDYHRGQRLEVLSMVPETVERVLDVGGGEGGFARALKNKFGCEAHLSEFSTLACDRAGQYVDKVWPGNFMTTDFDVRFDCISFLDVLEHTEWPLLWLKRAVQLLEPGGCLVISVSNVGHWSVVMDLLEGRWDYAPAGIHCITHLRFFTRFGVEQLLTEAGLVVEKLEIARFDIPFWFDCAAFKDHLSVNLDSLSSVGYLIRARSIK